MRTDTLTARARRRGPRALMALALSAALLSVGLAGLPIRIRAVFAQVGPEILSLAWSASEQRDSTSLAWGDVDNDGDLDLAVGNNNSAQPSQLYLNADGALAPSTSAWNPSPQPTTSLAWGDIDGDGDLDLAVGNSGAASQLYLNAGGALTLSTSAWNPSPQPTTSLAWGDGDGDGDLDLAVGNNSSTLPNQLYLNAGGALTLSAGWIPPAQPTTSLAWADVDSDGDLDLAVANGSDTGTNKIYLNNCAVTVVGGGCDTGSGLTTTTIWQVTAGGVNGDASSVVAQGDINGDGDPDLIIGINGVSSDEVQIYRSCATVAPDDVTACAGSPKPSMGAASKISGTARARSLAIGDMDGDGRLDLIVGRDRTLNSNTLLYLNPGDGSFTTAITLNISSDTKGLALADIEGDGDLDLAVANFQQSNQLFRNAGGQLFNAGWAPEPSPGVAAAWGDIDGDGDLDLAVANSGAASQLYLNAGGALTLSTAAWSPSAQPTTSLAWGDIDGDGDLDLAVANSGAASQLYLNAGGALALSTAAWSPSSQPTTSLAWGDVDGDGDLDLAVANSGAASQLYLNAGGALALSTAAWNPTAAATTSLAWGDVNGDSDLDLIVGNNNQPSQLYLNTNGRLTLDSDWQPAASLTQSVAWGDLDGDGQLDLVLGNEGQPNQIYHNDGGSLTLDTSWVPAILNTRSIALADVDGDRDLDLAVGNADQPSQLYLNGGAGNMVLSSWTPDAPAPTTRALAWGDGDGDGDADLAMINYEDGVQPTSPASRLYLSGAAQATPAADTKGAPRSFNRPPTVSIGRPETDSGGGLSAARIIATPTITISYSLADPEGDLVPTVRAFYSLDDGGTWLAAVPATGTQTTNLTTTAAGAPQTFVWDTAASGFFGQSDTVRFRIRAYASVLGGGAKPGTYRPLSRTPGPFQRPFATATSDAFRARGTQVRVVDENGAAVPGAVVYRLAAGASRGGAPMTDNADEAIITNGQGYLGGRGRISASDSLAAMVQQTVNDQYAQGKYRLFYTSPISINTGIPEIDKKSGNLRKLVVPLHNAAQTHPLILLDLNVGTEWDARSDAAYREQLQADLRRTSELLYDWTDGQVALGNVDIYLDGTSIAGTDIRIYATNRLRPGSAPGGIVRKDRPWHDGLLYTVGSASISATWNRYGGAGDTTGEDWPRALAHELGHFALYQEDNYIGRDDLNQLVTIPQVSGGARCPGAMSNPYNDSDSELNPAGSWGAACARTFSQLENKRSDWATILTYYPALHAPVSYDQHPGPNALTLDVTEFAISDPGDPALASPTFTLVQANHAPYTIVATARVRAILYASDGQRAIDLGRPTRDQLLARGARPGDRVCFYNQPDQLLGCATVGQGQSQLPIVVKPGWNPDITITPLSDHAFRVSVLAASVGSDRPSAISVRIFPRSLGAPADGTLKLLNDKLTYSGNVTLSESTGAALVRLWVPSDPAQSTQREAVTDLTLYGTPEDSTAEVAAIARKRKTPSPTVTPSGNGSSGCEPFCAPVAGSSDGQMLIYADPLGAGKYYTAQTASVVPAAPPWGVVVGQAYRLVSNMSEAEMAAKHASVNISYLEAELPAGTEGGLGIYFWDGASWTLLPSTRLDVDRNEVAVTAVGPGLYALITLVEVSPGWNNISYPWPGTLPLLSATAKLNIVPGRHFTTIHGYDQQDAANPWKVYDVDVPAWVNDLTELRYSQGYWFIVPSGGGTPALRGAVGLALGVPVPPATFYGVLPYHGALATQNLPVRAISNGVVCETSKTFKPTGTQQVAFLIEVRPAGQGAPAGCGVSGQPVTISIGGRAIGQGIWDNSRPITFRDTFMPLIFGPAARPPANTNATGGSSGSGSGSGSGNNGEQWIGRQVP